ncbi:hypothetical protein DVA86_27055 [Streptomyces armeniacus]|uniref:Uncharacterized protein n=2 Tax=Streptomyces armeniacus TaxID=83291 RepID=A0A345XVT1_9ACTN|nr:hypothetical protein DVA86_27055 [Streptomyces armeniacus]
MEVLMRSCLTPAYSSQARSPLGEFEEAFHVLAQGERPLTLPAHLVCEQPEEDQWPVSRVRAHLAHPATSPALRTETWREVVRRAHRLGEPWNLVAVAMTVPVLIRMLKRQALPGHLERAEVEQGALAAVATALAELEPGHGEPHRALFNAADREVHRIIDGARRRARREVVDETATLPPVASDASGFEECDEFAVLGAAMAAGVLRVEEARLIARTRLGGESVKDLAAARGISWRTLYRHRRAAEEHLAAWVRPRMRTV